MNVTVVPRSGCDSMWHSPCIACKRSWRFVKPLPRRIVFRSKPRPLAAGAWYHVAVTLNGSTGVLYMNGVPVVTNTYAVTLTPSGLGSTANNYLGKSQYSDPYFDGLFDEFRIYGVALSAGEIAATDALGPDQMLSTNRPSMGMTMAGNAPTLSWPLASAGFTLQSRTNLVLGNWVNVTSTAPQFVGDQWRVGERQARFPQRSGARDKTASEPNSHSCCRSATRIPSPSRRRFY